MSAKMKLKLTAIDGSRVRRVGVAWFGSSRSEDYGESGLVVLTNQGDLHVVSLPNVKMQVQYPCIRREDVSGIASCVFTKHGQGKNTPTHLCTVLVRALIVNFLGYRVDHRNYRPNSTVCFKLNLILNRKPSFEEVSTRCAEKKCRLSKNILGLKV